MAVDDQALRSALSGLLGRPVRRADQVETQLQGGTLGDVRLVTGTASTEAGESAYRLVLKTQQRWERPGDPGSWRREYDLFRSEVAGLFTQEFRAPVCYHAELRDDRTDVWLEYVDGTSGRDLKLEQLELAAFELGRWQGRIGARPELRRRLDWLGDPGFLRRDFELWRSATSIDSALPSRFRHLVADLDDDPEAVFSSIAALPVVLCHRDFWIENVICSDEGVRLIDWDTAGWGYAGEDIASLIADETEPDDLPRYFRKLVPAYRRGLSEHLDASVLTDRHVRELIMIKFGYRIVRSYLAAESAEQRQFQADVLESLLRCLS